MSKRARYLVHLAIEGLKKDLRPLQAVNKDMINNDYINGPSTSTEVVEVVNKDMINNDYINGPSTSTEVVEVEETEQRNEGRPRKGRSLKHGITRFNNKICRNSNKPYYDYKGNKKEHKSFINVDCKCTKKCVHIPEEDRRKEFDRFWELKSYDAQTAYIAAQVSCQPVKRRYVCTTEKSNRNFSRCYKLCRTIVCRTMFCKTLQISNCRVQTALDKMNSGESLSDKRGQQQAGHNAIPLEKRTQVINFINKIPVYKSHYCREKTDAKFLPPEMTLAKLFALYVESEKDGVSLASFKRIFYDSFNLRTKSLKKDTCNFCDKICAQIQDEKDAIKKEELTKQHKIHIVLAENAQKILKEDMVKASEHVDHECLTFDMQKTLPLPRIPTNIVFYKRQLWLYNCGIHSGKSKTGHCYVWLEGQAGRGAQEVGSCLIKHIQEKVHPTVKHLTLWADSCGGQNRNIKIALILKAILQKSTSLETIKIKYLYSGHSFLPNDMDFGNIEDALKHQQRLYTPDDYINIMKSCRKRNPLDVHEMKKEDFLGTDKLEKIILNRKVSVNNTKVNWFDVREIMLCKEDTFYLYFKMKLDGDVLKVDIKKHTRGRQLSSDEQFFNSLTPLWPTGKPIAPAKIKDLKSMLHLIPSDAKQFYTNLTAGTDNNEYLDGFNVNLDFEIEQ